ncbi:hypothetical protein [Nereida sp. MMG025]|uniref:hypothetical protein n=1 Tax=Nereida sp. MMG025 TaxID=2909981 RepID=UPI001F45F19A|nr:hypothetical protein [Nereida sp. MMG025]MCF6446084.1 hypothetical protein [Nereida sp. MMG025]
MTLSENKIAIERARLELETKRLSVTEELQRREITLKERQHQQRSISTAQATIAGALIALFSGWIGTTLNNTSSEMISETNARNALEI